MTPHPDAETSAPVSEASPPDPAPAPAPAAPDGTSAPSPAPVRARKRWVVTLFGREWPRATFGERFFWGALLLGCVVTLSLAAFVLDPDGRGIGTHEQLGLPPCGFVEMAGGPCPSCGFTTTFTLATHLRPIDALVNQPFGFLVFLLTFGGLLGLPLVAGKGISLFALTDRWPWLRIGAGLFLAWLIAWAYKWHMVVGF
jgi:hypothetical protein